MDKNDEHDDEIPGTFKRLCLRFEDLISVAFRLCQDKPWHNPLIDTYVMSVFPYRY